MKIWKRNAIIASVLLLVCAGVYLNWSKTQSDVQDLSQTLSAEQVMGEDTLLVSDGDGASADALDLVDEVLVRLSGENHLDYPDRLVVRVPETVDELRFLADLF